MLAASWRAGSSLDKGLARHVRAPQKGEHGLEHRKADVLALAGALARQERRGDRLRVGDCGQLVGQNGAQHARACVVGAGLDRGEPGKALDQRVVDRPLRIGAHLAKAADRDVDDLGRDGADRRFADAEPVGDAGAEILHKNVRRRGQPHQHPQARRVLQIEDNRALVAVVVEERGGKPATPVGPGPGAVAASGASTLITSAPWSPRIIVPNGPATFEVRSTMRKPWSGPGINRPFG